MKRLLYLSILCAGGWLVPATGAADTSISIRIGPAWDNHHVAPRIAYGDHRSHHRHSHRHSRHYLHYRGPVYWQPPRIIVLPPVYGYRYSYGEYRDLRHDRHRHGDGHGKRRGERRFR